jgi:prepilin-type processing-associated H-X9-DG protein
MFEKSKNWIDFWKNEDISNEQISRINMEIFVQATYPIMKYNSKDIILDLGCGFGHLSGALKGKVKEIHGIDISQRFLDICKQKYEQYDNLHFYKLDENNYTNFSFLDGHHFSKIVCLSVIQYYKNQGELENLIKSVKKIASKGAKFLISDIPTGNSSYLDMLSMMKVGIQNECLLKIIKHLFKHMISDYYRIRSTRGLLFFTKGQLQKISERLDIHAEILTNKMTINRNRVHLLISF